MCNVLFNCASGVILNEKGGVRVSEILEIQEIAKFLMVSETLEI
jgi:hypothetical protein